LAEPIQWLFVQQLALEVPQPVCIVDLVTPPADTGGHIATGGVPLNVGCHEMLCLHHDRHVGGVHKLQHSIHAATMRQNEKISATAKDQIQLGLRRHKLLSS